MMKYILGLLLLVGISSADFIRDDVKEIVIDTSTNLIWQDEEYTQAEVDAYNSDKNDESEKALHWDSAIDYCEKLTFAEHNDWRLPNFNELHTIADKSSSGFVINPVFKNFIDKYYWSSTTYNNSTGNAWQVCFHCGDSREWSKADTRYVRCVRSAGN